MIYYDIQVIFKSRYQTLYSHFQICFKECEENFFGRNCNSICNATCKSCNRSTGICDTGCLPGWRGEFCHNGSSSVNA